MGRRHTRVAAPAEGSERIEIMSIEAIIEAACRGRYLKEDELELLGVDAPNVPQGRMNVFRETIALASSGKFCGSGRLELLLCTDDGEVRSELCVEAVHRCHAGRGRGTALDRAGSPVGYGQRTLRVDFRQKV